MKEANASRKEKQNMNVFANALKSTLDNEVSITENGAVGFKTSGTKLVDLNFAVSSLRKADDSVMHSMRTSFLQSSGFSSLVTFAVEWESAGLSASA